MFFSLDSFALIGIDAIKVSVEVHLSNGIPSFTIVGLPDKSVSESRERVRAAIINSGFSFPLKRIIVNLSPAGIRKEGAFYDLPIALSILAISKQIHSKIFGISSFVGELSLDGRISPTRGVISMVEKAVEMGKTYFFVPQQVAEQASLIEGIKIIPSTSLLEVIRVVSGERNPDECVYKDTDKDTEKRLFSEDGYGVDFCDVKGQLRAKRALEIAVSGMHNIMMVGPPGAGKSMLAQRVVTIMPPLSTEEQIEITKIYSLHKSYNGSLVGKRPFRSPHHTITRVGLIGGGNNPKPGEISLSHRGVLFLDEFSQFPRNLIEDLRQPLEDRRVIITRNSLWCSFPCNFMLIVATNPCYCGFLGDEYKRCICSYRDVKRFWKNFSGPILDRIDMIIKVPRLKENEFVNVEPGEKSIDIRKRVIACTSVQERRFKDKNIKYNSEADLETINLWISESKKIKEVLPGISEKYNLTGRGMVSVLKVARTIADLDGDENIELHHLMEALHYRTEVDFEKWSR